MKACVAVLLCLGIFPVAGGAQTAAAGAEQTPIDFSFAGYAAGGPVPLVPAVLAVEPSGKDDTQSIQDAIDTVARLPLGKDGFRGAVLLRAGTFHVSGELHLQVGGIVLRGSGAGSGGTAIVAEGHGRRTLITVGADKDPVLGATLGITDGTVPVGASALHVGSTAGLAVGDHVEIRRPSTAAWISAIGMTGLQAKYASFRLDWQPGSHDLVWDRTITAIGASGEISIDAPITTAIEKQYGGGTVAVVESNPPAEKIGIENLLLDSAYDHADPVDEEHAWIAIEMNHVEDAWVRNVTGRHFVSSLVRVEHQARRITIEDCRSEAPISEQGGYRRESFLIAGQQVLVYRCHSEDAMHDFSGGLLAPGPIVFLDCDGQRALGPSGAFQGWASGLLLERVHISGASLQLVQDQSHAQGGGWTAANSIIWNSTGTTVDAMGAPGGLNRVVNSTAALYEAQLKARTGHGLALANVSFPVERSVRLYKDDPVPAAPEPPQHPLSIVQGRFVIDGKAVWGTPAGESWWKGQASPALAASVSGFCVSLFIPGETGPGLTEDLPALIATLKARDTEFVGLLPGLWYDRRRDEHSLLRRNDGNVWAPFYEMPWARSGQGKAWDGLSRYDLSRYNSWYFDRHREFIKLAGEQGMVVYDDLYNDHNVLEIGPHWMDFPWRPANNINNTGLPEPPPLRPDEKLAVGNQFFDPGNPALRSLHHAYIFHALDRLGDMPNVIFSLAFQYAGPLSFQQFFGDTISEWEHLHSKQVHVAIITGKATTDAILNDPVRSKQIDVVDLRYWEYRPDGSLFAPRAGENLAFRELIRASFPGSSDWPPPTTPEQAYRQVREYHDRYPEKAIVAPENGGGPLPILMAGGAGPVSLGGVTPGERAQNVNFEKLLRESLASDLVNLEPADGWTADTGKTWTMAGGPRDPVLIYSLDGSSITLNRALPQAGSYSGTWFDAHSGTTQPAENVPGAAGTVISKPSGKEWLLVLRPKNE